MIAALTRARVTRAEPPCSGGARVLRRAEPEHRQQRFHDGRVEVRAGAAPQLDGRAGRGRAFE